MNPTIVAIAADPTEARVVRERALGRVVAEYVRLDGAPAESRCEEPAA